MPVKRWEPFQSCLKTFQSKGSFGLFIKKDKRGPSQDEKRLNKTQKPHGHTEEA